MKRQERLDDIQEGLRLVCENNQASIWSALPAIVTSVDLAKQTISAQPTIQGVITDSEGNSTNTNLPLLVDVPICFPRAGGFAITFPIAVNDEVLIIFSARCIDGWWQSGKISPQMELRMHDLSDGFAIFAPTSQPKVLSSVSSANLQMRTADGANYLEITPAGNININAQQLNINAQQVTITANTVTINGINFNQHKHVDSQGGDTGIPIN